nr:immunoglobulin light chain junction region [Macaca mulatta]
CVQGIQFPLTF